MLLHDSSAQVLGLAMNQYRVLSQEFLKILDKSVIPVPPREASLDPDLGQLVDLQA